MVFHENYIVICCSSYYNGTDSGGECGVPYEKRFIMPRPAINKHWYVIHAHTHAPGLKPGQHH